MTPIVHITDKEQALQRENANMLDTINKQAVSIEKLRKVLEMKDLTIEAMKVDAERYRWLKAWNRVYGWSDSQIDRQIAIDKACADAARKEQS